MEVAALLLTCIAAMAAVGAWLAAVHANTEASRSADAAEKAAAAGEKQAEEERRANYLASRPDVELTTDGVVEIGVETYLVSDRDLDELTVELLPLPAWDPAEKTPDGRRKLIRPDGMMMNAVSPIVNFTGQATTKLVIMKIRAGQRYRISVRFRERAPRAKLSFRLVAVIGEDRWVLSKSLDEVELQWRY